jgi:glutamate-1-semialdehyde 2,1-aminomutase
MEKIAPTGPVYQAGTLSGNPLAMRAGLETLDLLDDDAYRRLEGLSERLENGLARAAGQAAVGMTSNRVGSMMTAFFSSGDVINYTGAAASDTDRYGRFFHGMLERGVYLAPSQFEAAFVSLAHTEEDIDTTIASAESVLETL